MECVRVLRSASWLRGGVRGCLDADESDGAGESCLVGEQTTCLCDDKHVECENDERNKTTDEQLSHPRPHCPQ